MRIADTVRRPAGPWTRTRLRTLVDAYGIDESERRELVDLPSQRNGKQRRGSSSGGTGTATSGGPTPTTSSRTANAGNEAFD